MSRPNPNPSRHTPEQRDAAIERAAQVGDEQAAREMGVTRSVLRKWRSRAGKAGPRAGVQPEDWAARKEQGARDAYMAAQETLVAFRKALADEDFKRLRELAIPFGIMVDKSGVLESHADAARLRAAAARVEVLDGEVVGMNGAEGEDRLRELAQVLKGIGVFPDDDGGGGGDVPRLPAPLVPPPAGDGEMVVLPPLPEPPPARRERRPLPEPEPVSMRPPRWFAAGASDERPMGEAAIHWDDRRWRR